MERPIISARIIVLAALLMAAPAVGQKLTPSGAGGTVIVGVSPGNTVLVTSGDYECSPQDRMIFVRQTASVATRIVLPLAPALNDVVTVKDAKGDAAINHITVAGPIDGVASYVMGQNYQAMGFRWNNTEWSVQ